MLFKTQDIVRNFDARDYNRGRTYQTEGKVKTVTVENAGKTVSGAVEGTSQPLYFVNARIEQRKGLISIESDCTCPVGYMCKHGVATLLEAIAQETRNHERMPSAKAAHAEPRGQVSKAVHQWLELFDQPQPSEDFATSIRIAYLIAPGPHGRAGMTIALGLQTLATDGSWGPIRHIIARELYTLKHRSSIMNDDDRAIITTLQSLVAQNTIVSWEIPDDPALVSILLDRTIQTGRAFISDTSPLPLKKAKPANGKLTWRLALDGLQHASIAPENPKLLPFPAATGWYINPETNETGPILCQESPATISRFLQAPPLTEKEAEFLTKRFQNAQINLPRPNSVTHCLQKPLLPKPHIVIHQIQKNLASSQPAFQATLAYQYDQSSVNPLSAADTYAVTQEGIIKLYKRHTEAEETARSLLRTYDLELVNNDSLPAEMATTAFLVSRSKSNPWFWHDFLFRVVPLLEKKGFIIDRSSVDISSMIVQPDDMKVDAAFEQSGNLWFSIDLGIHVNGKRVQLLPILVAMIKRLKTPQDIEMLKTTEKCYAPLPDGRHIALESKRIYSIVKTLIELFEDKSVNAEGRMPVSLDIAATLSNLEVITQKRWLGENKLQKLLEKLNDFTSLKHTALPKKFDAKLRPYQVDGYNWLHFLGEYGLSGILADDMGLGKTVQTLAYIQSKKERKELNGPVLIVMPTSLIANWHAEATRFTPELSVLILHGKDRAGLFKKAPKYDLVFSTYPLLPRDKEQLCSQKWSLVILDEAQCIKNPGAKVTQAACALMAEQRLCLTGTPIENHLGEAWSLFTFLLPGLLGNQKRFNSLFRTPIEKQEDGDRKDLLIKRLRPFILRRNKNEVATDLPPKTEIIRRVTLSDDQRDLYETVRHVMNEKVREEISAKGLARSQIFMLDALLKLRQTCCDPRLVKLEAARHAKNSAKLEELKEMLPTLIEDGRKILLFSQFTSMLDLIKKLVVELDIPFVELRGSTKDRVTPITRFQKGDVPLFLISLKAGGTGLNLTAADTVIHYDPWWNPAVENQATDRAHRIGQNKPVFVYKLIAEGTVEEKILNLQEHKASLASSIFGDKSTGGAALTQDDFKWLLSDG